MPDWIPIHKGDAQFGIVQEMGAGIGSTVSMPGEQFRAWYHVHHGTLILIAGESIKPEGWTVPAPDGVVRVQRRGADGISTTLDLARGRPYLESSARWIMSAQRSKRCSMKPQLRCRQRWGLRARREIFTRAI